MTFGHPLALWLAGAGPAYLLIVFLYDRARRRQLAHRLGDLPVIERITASVSPRRRAVKLVLLQLALTLIALAIARPQIAGKREVALRGLDLVVAVDVSKSMLVDDVGQTEDMARKKIPASRLGRARELAGAVIDELAGDRIGPVVFAGAAAHFPLTEDHEVAVQFLYDLGPADLPPGSNLAEVFRVSRCLLRPDLYDDLGCVRIGRRGHGGDPLPGDAADATPTKEPDTVERIERGKAIVVFTDGGDDDTEALREVATARELGIAVFVVGLGTEHGGVVHEIDGDGNATSVPKRTKDNEVVVSKRDDAGMKAIAAAGGDETRYVIASDQGEVDPMPIATALRAVNRGLAVKKVDELHDVFQPYLFAALMLLVIEAAIATRRRRRYPEERHP